MELPKMDRKQKIEIYGSPRFPFNPGILADASWFFSPQDYDPESKYLPMDSFIIHNNSTSDIEVKYRDNTMYIIAGTVREEKNVKFNELVIKELSSVAIVAGTLRIEIFRAPMDADKKALKEVINMAEGLRNIFSMSGGL